MSVARTLLIVEDDELLRRALKEQLAAQGDFADIDEAADGAAALVVAKSKVFDVILLDIGLPDIDGREVCQRMRDAGVRSPIIMLTAADSEDDTITGLDAGANDLVGASDKRAKIHRDFSVGLLPTVVRARVKGGER